MALFPNDSRSELAKTICEHLNWHTPKGDYRVSVCLRILERLEGFGILTLPEKQDNGSGALPPIRHTAASDRAANWERIGMTAGRKSGRRAKPAKEILVLPLDRDFRDVLRGS